MAGFTLIEMLVVISIISILMGVALVGINSAREAGDSSAVETDLQFLRSAIEKFSVAMGDYPPTRLSDLDPKLKGNPLNEGNESLFACLLSRRGGGPHAELAEDRWENLDGDSLTTEQLGIVKKELDWIRGNGNLLEYCDLWGQPYIYFHHRDYGTARRVRLADGSEVEVAAQKNAQTGTYFAPTTFQLWSIGPNGINENGGGDDLVSWR